MICKQKIIRKIKQWLQRYLLPEIVSYSCAIWWWTFIFYITNNYYISGISVIILDNLWYYLTIIIKEIIQTKLEYWTYNTRLFLKDFRNLGFEFGIPQIIEIYVVYPLLVFYIPQFFLSYPFWIFVAMTIAVLIFYLQAIILYEFRKKYFK